MRNIFTIIGMLGLICLPVLCIAEEGDLTMPTPMTIDTQLLNRQIIQQTAIKTTNLKAKIIFAASGNMTTSFYLGTELITTRSFSLANLTWETLKTQEWRAVPSDMPIEVRTNVPNLNPFQINKDQINGMLKGLILQAGFRLSVDQAPTPSISETTSPTTNNAPITATENSLQGEVKTWYPTSQLKSSITYFEGKKNGRALTYYESGQIKSDETYALDKKQGRALWYYPNGQIQIDSSYTNDRKNGIQRRYYVTGQIESEEAFIDGLADGYTRSYFASGQLQSDGFFVKGIRQGLFRSYSESGQLLTQESWQAGQKQSTPK